MTLEITVLFVALTAIALVTAWTVLTGSPPTPTSPRVRRAMLACLPSRLPDGVIYELGAGWGGLSLELARRYPGISVVGIEVSPLPWLAARLRGVIQRRTNLLFRYGDFRKTDVSDAALVVCYLSAGVLADLKPKLEREMPAGALVLSSTFAVPGWRPVDTVTADDLYRSPIYLYEREVFEVMD